jgi:hypothetical protein
MTGKRIPAEYNTLFGNLKAKDQLGDLGVEGMAI